MSNQNSFDEQDEDPACSPVVVDFVITDGPSNNVDPSDTMMVEQEDLENGILHNVPAGQNPVVDASMNTSNSNMSVAPVSGQEVVQSTSLIVSADNQ